jgi:hypothetical protein
LPKFTGSTTIGDSAITDNGTTVSLLSRALSGTTATFNFGNFVGAGARFQFNSSNTPFVINALNNNGSAYIGWNVAAKSGSDTGTYILSQAATKIEGDGGSIRLYTAPSGTSGNDITFTEQMRIFSDGNLLLQSGGTFTNNGARLQVSGEGRFYQPLTSTTSYLTVENNRSRNAAIRLKTTVGDFYLGVGIGADVNQFQIYDGTAGANRLTINSTGAATFSSRVGVGGASATYPLTAYNASNGTTAAFGGTARGIRIDNDGTFSSGRSTIFGVDNTFYGSYQPLAIGGSELYFSISGTDRLTISSTGAATFSSSVDAVGRFGATTNQTTPTDGTAYFYKSSAGAVVSGFQFIAETGGAGSRGTRLTIDNAGAATFSSNVTTTGGFLQFPNNYGVEGRNAANTAHRTVLKLNTSNQIEIGRDTDISSIILGTASAVNALTIASTGAATFSSSVTATSETTNSSLIQQWSYNGNAAAYKLRLNTIVSSGLVRYSFDTTNSSTEYPNNLVIDRGNVGIGVSPNTKLEVTSGNSGSTEIQRWSYNDGNAAYSLRLKQDVSSGLVKHVFDVVNNSTTYSNNLVLTNGNVGIGTPSPAYSLDVVSSGGIIGRFTGNSGAYLILRANGVRDWWLANGVNSGTDGWFSIYNATAGSQGLVITSTNNVLIGTTSDNGARLQVSGTSTISGDLVLTNGANRILRIGSSTNYYYDLQTVGDNFQIREAGSTPRLTFTYPTGAATFSNLSGSGNRIVVANSGGTLISAVIGSGLAFDGTTLTATGGGSGSISGSGTSGTIALFTGATSIGNSAITQSGSNVTFSGGINPTKTAKNTYGIQIRGAFYGAPRLQVYDLAADPNGYMGLGTDMSGAPFEFSNYFPRTGGNGKWSVGSWAGDFGTGQYVSGYNEKLFIVESAAQFNVPLTVSSSVTAGTFVRATGGTGASSGKGVEIGYESGDFGTIIAYDRTAGSFKRLSINDSLNILSGNLVGIGVSPATNLHVQAPSVSYGQFRLLNSSSSGEASMHIGRTNQTLEQRWTIGQGVAGIGDSFGFYTGGSSRVNLQTNGNVVIGTTADNGNRLRVDGTIWSDSSITATSFFESSDATLKTLIADNYQVKGIDSVVAKLYIKNGKEEIGYFAQDLQDVLPSAVSKGSDGLLNLSYREVHTAKIAYLEERIKQLEKKYENN